MSKLQQLIERDQWAELLTSSTNFIKKNVIQTIEVFAFSESEALKKAIDIFDVADKHIEIDNVKKGTSNFFGFIKTPNIYTISIDKKYYEHLKQSHLTQNTEYFNEYNNLAANKNGSFRIIMKKKGLTLTVYPPEGVGIPVTLEDIESELKVREYNNINLDLINKALKSFQETIVGAYEHSPNNDSTFSTKISESQMSVYFAFSKPREHGRVPEVSEILEDLKSKHVTVGIKESVIQEAIDNELYGVPIGIAEGIPVQHGQNAQIEYKFPVGDETFKHAVHKDGSVDFKMLNIIHNVLENEILAIMHPATKGKDGYNVLGQIIPAEDGIPLEWHLGQNVHLSPDKTKALASQSGQVYIKNKQICVDPALEINSDVDLSTGNIDFLGNVIIKGNISDGFSVISGGNIEVFGHIGKCLMFAEGNIIAHQGIQGKDDAQITCNGNLFANFIERSSVTVGGDLIITKALLHSNAIVDKGIYVLDEKKSIIAGGDIKAQDEIFASQIGAESYIETHLEVGYSKNIIQKNRHLVQSIQQIDDQIIELNKQLLSKLSPNQMHQLQKNITILNNQKNKQNSLLESNRETLYKLSTQSTISASIKFMPGVKVRIGAYTLDINREQSSGTIKGQPSQQQILLETFKPSPKVQEFISEYGKQSNTRKRK